MHGLLTTICQFFFYRGTIWRQWTSTSEISSGVRNDLTKREGPIALQFSVGFWVGGLNPVKNDMLSSVTSFFVGDGLDNGDGKADKENNDDLMLTSNYLS